MPSCTNCGSYAGEEKWRTLCRKCFVKQKKREEEEKDEQLADLLYTCQELRAELTKSGRSTIPDAKLKQLIFLCHPDKHNNSETANEVTQWLLSLRKKK